MLRNVASQKYRVYAWDATTGLAKTGDAANISAYIQIDDGTAAATNDAAPTEASSSNQPGYYDFDLTQAETNGAKVSLSPKSSTADVAVIACPPVIYTRPQYLSLLGIASDGDLTKVNTLDGHTPQTGDTFALANGANGFVALKADTAAILTDTGNTLDALIQAIKTKTDALPTDPADASVIAGLIATLQAVADAIDAKTVNLPSDPADQSLIVAATDAIMTRLGAPAGASVSADVAAVKSDTATAATQATTAATQATAGAASAATAASQATTAATQSTAANVAAAAVKVVTDKLATAIEDDGGVSRFTTNALEQAPGGGGGALSSDQDAALTRIDRTVKGIASKRD